MKTFRVLFTGIGRRIELVQAFREAALSLDKELKIYGADSSRTAPALAFCDYRRQVCGMKEEGYIDELLTICREGDIDLLIPTIDTDLLVLSEQKGRFEAGGTRVLVSSPEMVRICRDKNLTSRFFLDCGLEAPLPVNDWRAYQGGFPAFIKPKDGSSSIDAYKVRDIRELEQYASRVEGYIVQPFIEGTEYTVDILGDFNGSPVSIIPRIRLAVRAGEVLKTQIDTDGKIIAGCRSIAAAFCPCGPITVQLIRDKKGEDHYIEINPRFGGGAPLSMKAGAKSAEAILRLLSGEEIPSSQEIADGAVYSRFDQSVCVKEGKRALPVRGVIFDLDDTLYSERAYVESGYQAVAGYLGDGSLADRMREYFEQGKPAIDECLKEIGKTEEKDGCLKVYRSHKPDICLYEGIKELLEELKAGGIKVGIITDGRPEGQRNKLEALGLPELADDIIITDELGGAQFRKPCDIAFRIMALRWRLPYERLAYIGDNTAKDFQAPQQLGIRGIWFRNREGLYQGAQEGNGCGAWVCSIEELRRTLGRKGLPEEKPGGKK